MIGVIAHLTVKDGKQAEFEAVAKDLIEKVRANEPGCLMYELFKEKDSDTEYYFMEKYADKDAIAAHGASDYFQAAQPALGACLAGRPTITRLSAIA